jgi:hypothetical protein
MAQLHPIKSRASSVGIATGYGLDGPGSISGRDRRFFGTSFQIGSGSHSASIQWVARALSPEVKRPGYETDYSPPSSAEVKNVELYLHSIIHINGVVHN